MSDNSNWETVDAPRGAFISWGNRVGQHVTGKVVDYDPQGGVDPKERVVPLLTVELTEKAASINREGERTDYDRGELVNLTVSQVSLKRNLRVADPKPGDLLKVTLSNLVKVSNGTVKEFEVKIARRSRGGGSEGSVSAQPAAVSAATPQAGGFDDEPPF